MSILDFGPKLVESGTEPTLRTMVELFYENWARRGIYSEEFGQDCAKRYIAQIEEQLGEGEPHPSSLMGHVKRSKQ